MEETSKRKKIIGVTTVIVVIALALVVGVSVYSAPGNKLTRQLDLGHKYLGNGQYEEAALAFEKAIEIDEKCMEAYVGGIEAYLQTGNREAMLAFYDRAMDVIENGGEGFLAQNRDAVVSIYLFAEQVYAGVPQQAVEILEKGFRITEGEEIKDKLVDSYLALLANEDGIRDYKEELEIYDRLLELAGDEERVLSSLEKCLRDYIEFLKGEEKYDDIRALAEKYGDVVSGIDFDEILRQAEEEKKELEEAEEAELEGDENIETELSESGNWVDDLYQKIITGDAEGVFGIITASDFIDKCEMFPYEVVAWSNDYRLSTSDGKFIWVVKEIDGVFLSVAYHPDHNYYDPAWGTPEVFEGSYAYEIDFDGSKSWLFKSIGHEEDGSMYELQEGALWKRIFHM